MLLRPYQSAALESVQGVYRSGRKRVLLVAPTGAGKSAMMRYMLERTSKRTLILCHRAELLEMIADSLTVPHGIIEGSRRVPSEKVHVGMMQTVSRRLGDLPDYDWVISDEAHLAMCPTWRRILQHYSSAWHLGLSATPCRLDGQGLGAEYEQIVHGPSIRELTDRGYLSPCRVFAPATEGRDAKKAGGDFSMSEAAEAVDRASITGDALAHYQRLAPGRQALAFCCNREHAEHVAQAFTAGGVPALNVDGSMPDRAERIAAFRAGKVRVLTNVELLTTGFDFPELGCGIFLRPTQSLALHMQIVGRYMRVADGKRDAILIDHVGNVLAHGMPDEEREWTLEGRAKRSTAAPVVICPACYAAHRPGPRCPSCDHIYEATRASRMSARVREGDLVEVGDADRPKTSAYQVKEMVRQAFRQESDFGIRLALQQIQREQGYKPSWVFMQMQLRAKYRGGKRAA
jgi:DNA repair protein RadD